MSKKIECDLYDDDKAPCPDRARPPGNAARSLVPTNRPHPNRTQEQSYHSQNSSPAKCALLQRDYRETRPTLSLHQIQAVLPTAVVDYLALPRRTQIPRTQTRPLRALFRNQKSGCGVSSHGRHPPRRLAGFFPGGRRAQPLLRLVTLPQSRRA